MTTLNLGCRDRKIEGFDNLDKIYGWTFQEGLPQYKNASVDAITISHALMFLTNKELLTFLNEAYRVLKVGGVIRITEDDTENPNSDTYKTGKVKANPACLTGPNMMRSVLEIAGLNVFELDETHTKFEDTSLLQNYHGGIKRCFFMEGVKGSVLTSAIKKDGSPYKITNGKRDDLPQFFVDMGFKVGAEIGVYKGEFSEKIAKTGIKLFSIDPWKVYKDYNHPRGQERLDFQYEHTKRVLSPYPNAEVVRKTSMEALDDFNDESLDFVYIDGNHDFKYIAEDLVEWSKKVKKGGIISGHDYTYIESGTGNTHNHVAHILNAYIECFQIPNWYLLSGDSFPSWMFFKPWARKVTRFKVI